MRIGGVPINILVQDKSFLLSTLWILTLSLSSAYFLSLAWGFLILSGFFGAMIAVGLIIETNSKEAGVPNLFHRWTPTRWHEGFSCPKCSQIDCLPHINSSEPWKDLQLPLEIDAALAKIIEGLLQTYVNDWYTSLSLDDELSQNLGSIIRHLCANLARRCVRLDLASLITEEVTSCALRHLIGVFQAEEISKALPYGDVETMRKEFFDLPSIHIHEALKSREHETNYLLDLSSAIVPHLLPPKETKCQSVRYLIEDLLSGAVLQPIADITPNPDIINHLLILAFDPSHSKKLPELSGTKVGLLEGLIQTPSITSSSRNTLKMDLSAILKNQLALFAFMKFLKEEYSISSLQFCLSVEDFNKKIMDPSLSNNNNQDENLDGLHSEAVNLFDVYLRHSSPYRVNVSQELVEEIRLILMKPVASVLQLRTSPPLFKAYEEVYNYLELEMCPLFHKSEEYFMFLLGKRTEDSLEDPDKSGSRSLQSSDSDRAIGRLSNVSSSSSLGSRTKLNNEGIENSAIDVTNIYDEEDIRPLGLERRHGVRDISSWQVSIPRLSAVSSQGKPHFVFVIDVLGEPSSQAEEPRWSVKRRSSEFYALEAKLTEFHGDFEDLRLPPKSKLFAGKGLDSLQAKQGPFQDYVAQLLQKPALRESDLLYTFLTSKEEFTLAASKLGKMIKNVKLTKKEKGQGLQPFIDAFMESTMPGSPKPRPDFLISKDPEGQAVPSHHHHPLYGDNAERGLSLGMGENSHPPAHFDPKSMENVEGGICDSFIYLALRIFNLSKWKLELLMMLRMVFKNSLDHLVRYGIAYKLRSTLLNSSRIAYLIKLGNDVIFGQGSTAPRTNKEKTERMLLAKNKFTTFLSPYLSPLFGKEDFQKGTERIFNALQDPILNKQLFYQLLEVLVLKLIPEIQR
eukprot:TRINITY_DN7180_c0_g1_i1.p1 TRINITY_DN7180_c0_g1~~TRINITY_DN7180_c0_g1_i1.p1  ORF type:complete len:909 (+),score=283.90 TRINITY_DN7180_c0_g1_i1:93-2819(+)